MWLPTPIYERVTQFWVLLGLLFMTSGTYLGFDYSLSFLYFAVGAACTIWSGVIFVRRSRYRARPIPTIQEEDAQNQEQTADSTEPPAEPAS